MLLAGASSVGRCRWVTVATFATTSLVGVAAVGILGFLVAGMLAGGVDFVELVGSATWDPTRGEFGALAMIWGTLTTSLLALLLAAPVGWLAAVAINELASTRLRRWARAVTEMLAAVPSIVFGLLGIAFVRPFISQLVDVPGGDSLLTGGLVLAVMILPTITAVSVDALAAVPSSMRESATAVGLHRVEVIRHAVLPSAATGMRAAGLLGLARALGETVAIFLLVGRADGRLPTSPIDALSKLVRPGQTLTSKLNGPEPLLANTSGPHWSALCALGLLLLLGVAALTLVGLRYLGRSGTTVGERGRRSCTVSRARGRALREVGGRVTIFAALAVPLLLTVAIVILVVSNGREALIPSFWTDEAVGAVGGGVRNELLGTLLLVATAGVIAAPAGLGVGIMISAIGSARSRLMLRAGVLTLGAIPSIVLGLAGYRLLSTGLGWGKSWLVGGLALAVVAVPVVAVAVAAAVDAIPPERRETGAALGLRRGQFLRSVVIPHARPGLITGLLLGLARAAGETAPLIFTATVFSGASALPGDIRNAPVQALPTRIFNLAQDSSDAASRGASWGAAFVLLVVASSLALAAVVVRRRMEVSRC